MRKQKRKRLLKTPGMAAELGVSSGKVRDLRLKRIIPSIQVNRRLILYSPEKVMQALERLGAGAST